MKIIRLFLTLIIFLFSSLSVAEELELDEAKGEDKKDESIEEASKKEDDKIEEAKDEDKEVKEALEEGRISELRYSNYLQLLDEVEDQNYWELNTDF